MMMRTTSPRAATAPVTARLSRALGPLLLSLVCAGQLGCAELIMAAAGGARSDEDDAWLAGFAKKYNDTAAAAKKDFDSMEAYFNALVLAQDCSDSSHGQLELGWTVETVDGPMRVEEAQNKCKKMRDEIRKKGTSEEACGYASLSIAGGELHSGTPEWTTTVSGRRNADTEEAKGFDGGRQLVSCDKLPPKGNKPAPIWKKEHIAEAERLCEQGSIIVYDSTEWKNGNASSGDEKYLVRYLDGHCWYPKARIGEDFSVPPPCNEDGTPPRSETTFSCLTKAGKLVVR